ncbi:MAG: hypothetical protein HC876_08005 [Chloroflexaceae bacterium]|nr:hypothetical protein [Chloroflexaceae bacterium]
MFSNRSRHQRSTSASYRRRAHPLVALLKWAVALPIIGYLCVLTVLLVGWQVAPTRFDLFEITNVFALWFCLPLLVVAPLAYGLRLWGSFVGTMVLLLVVVASFGLGMLPNLNRPTLASTTGPLLRVVTHNKLYFTDDTQALARVLLAQDADIIGLQELTGNDKQALDTLLAEHYPYRALDNDGPLGSLGLLSRFPIVRKHGCLGSVRPTSCSMSMDNQSMSSICTRQCPKLVWTELVCWVALCPAPPTTQPDAMHSLPR